ncbi:glycoside hydrolase family 3 C-terminal domain-containing protein [Phyllosticta paracitricarpa]|uniref:beta-glucosidase n=1 Tax=Phyllosticta paracitricarpa TaxID=2016321 RepID=A0ABR1NK28_9PEZI
MKAAAAFSLASTLLYGELGDFADADARALAMTWNKDYFEAEAKALGREIHLDGVKAGMAAVMCAMSRVNNSQSCENSHIVSELLQAELGFPGMVFPDVNSQTTPYGSANAGQDYGSSSYWTSQPSEAGSTDYRDVRSNHSALIREVSAASLVPLKNNVTTSGGIPLDRPKSIKVFSAHAGPAMAGPKQAFSVQRFASIDWRHGRFQQLQLQQHERIGGGGGDGNVLSNLGQGTAVTPSITNYAEDSEVCLVFLNSISVGRFGMECYNTIVVINTVRPRLVDAWIELENVTAVLYDGTLGQESDNAIADVLYGDVNPSGKLINTIAKNESHYPVQLCYTADCDFDGGVYIDYRHIDRYNVTPRYSFGHGLSFVHDI